MTVGVERLVHFHKSDKMEIILKDLSYEEVKIVKKALGAKLMKKAKIDYGVNECVECPVEFDELPNVVAKQCANEAYSEICKCNTHLDTMHDERDVRTFICDVFCDDIRYALKKMLGCGRNKFICRIVGMMYYKGYYGSTSVDILARDLRLLYKGVPNYENSRRYIFRADREDEWND